MLSLPTREELSKLEVSVQYTSLLRPHFLKSETSCGHQEECECPVKFVCPLCPVEIPSSLPAMEEHYQTVHWDQKVSIIGTPFTVFPCGDSHQESVSVRRRTMLPSAAVQKVSQPPLHFHCPYCVVFRCPASSEILILDHVVTKHPQTAEPLIYRKSESSSKQDQESESCVLSLVDKESSSPVSAADPSSPPTSPRSCRKKHVKFQDRVGCKFFPLAVSIVDQLGGMKESKREKFCMGDFVAFSVIGQFASDSGFTESVTRSGCDQPVYSLFKGFKFLVCGTNIPLSVCSAITSLKGEVSGARYDDSQEWPNLTHVILGTRLAAKSIREIRKLVPLDVLWVTSDWIRSCVEHGAVYYNQPNMSQFVFSPAAIERYFMIQQAAVRMERRKSMRAKPDIRTPSSPTNRVTFADQVPEAMNLSVTNSSAYSTPRLSPVVQMTDDLLMVTPPEDEEQALQMSLAESARQTHGNPSAITSPTKDIEIIDQSPNRRSRPTSSVASPTNRNISGISPPLHPIDPPKRRESVGGHKSETAAPVVESQAALELRRSKRISMAPVKFSYTHHHSIKKP